jgi:LysR family transcriptional regulator, nod-box dependent transcriptional activator
MRFKGLDLNLLVALDVLLEERNVTRAAERMHVGQSAMSAALSRLRQHFSDDLLVISGRRMMPTALAEGLRQPLRDAILQIETVVDIEREFLPGNSRRHFKVEMPDHLVPVLLPLLTRRVAADAPNIVLDVRPPSRDPTPSLHKGELDLVVTPSIYSDADYVAEPLLTNELALVGWRDNPALRQQPDLETVYSLQQVIVEFDRDRLASMLTREQLALYGGTGRIALVAPNFSCIPPCLVGTNWINLVYRPLALLAARDHPLAIWDVPIPMPSMPEVMMFHPMRRQDGGLSWLRDQLRAAAAEIQA